MLLFHNISAIFAIAQLQSLIGQSLFAVTATSAAGIVSFARGVVRWNRKDRTMFGECHGHMILDGVDFRKAKALHRPTVNEDAIRRCFERYRSYDILFFRDGGDNQDVSLRAKEIAPEYGIDYRMPVCALHKAGNYGGIVGKEFSDMDGFRKLFDEVVARGADFIKIMASGIMDFDRFGTISEGVLTLEELREIVRISHAEGLAVMVHVNGSETIQNVLKAGADSIEHGYYMDDETIRRLADSKTVWVPTVVTVANLLKDPKHRYHTESVKQILALQEENIRKAVKAGCMLAAGSDAGAYMVPHCDGLVDEVECFKHILADDAETDRVLTRGENAIKSMFRRNYG